MKQKQGTKQTSIGVDICACVARSAGNVPSLRDPAYEAIKRPIIICFIKWAQRPQEPWRATSRECVGSRTRRLHLTLVEHTTAPFTHNH